MTNIFLKAKHWHLFILTFGIPIVAHFFFMAFMVINFSFDANPDPASFVTVFQIFLIVFALFALVLFGWMYSVGTGLQVIIPEESRLKVINFKIFFFFQLFYVLLFLILFLILSNSFVQTIPYENPEIIAGIFLILLPIHLFAMFCSLYVIYFVAKTIKTVELKKQVTFSDFIGEFLLIWIYPIGIWFIQPKINRIIESEGDLRTPDVSNG